MRRFFSDVPPGIAGTQEHPGADRVILQNAAQLMTQTLEGALKHGGAGTESDNFFQNPQTFARAVKVRIQDPV